MFDLSGIRNGVFLAPLAGITDPVFRLLCRSFGASLVCSEMVSAHGLMQRQIKTHRYIEFEPDEHPIMVQLFGSDPDIMAEATRVAAGTGPDLIDVNCGCPVHKVVKKGAGAALMKDLPRAEKVISAMVKAVDIPVTVKLRSGWDTDHRNAVEFARMAEDAGAAMLTVHPRVRKQFFKGPADWQVIADVKKAVRIPVTGNGDVTDGPSAKAMFDQTGCDHLMVGRASFGNPWVFRDITAYLTDGTPAPPVTPADRFAMCRRHLAACIKRYGPVSGVHKSKKQIAWYTRSLRFSTRLRQEVFRLSDAEAVEEALARYEKMNTEEDIPTLQTLSKT